MQKRTSGILMPVFSLPGPFGTGCFDERALSFARMLAQGGFSSWQVLPFTPTGYGHSPYQGFSAYAGNPFMINLKELWRMGLLTDGELTGAYWPGQPDQVAYAWLEQTRDHLLHKAFSRISVEMACELEAFADKERDWLDDYALFRTIKRHQGEKPWWAWTDRALREAAPEACAAFRRQHDQEIRFIQFIEWVFACQWQDLKQQINALGIQVIGDIPIYVSADSSDVWADRRYFDIDEAGVFRNVAGVPPDYFSADGQLWGNPLYRWDVMARDGYAWWIKRIKTGLTTFDWLRIDHFRGFESFWAVPGGETTARKGNWIKGPAMDLFRQIEQAFPDAPIIAEDLGIITDDVRQFLASTGLPGMKVMQFSFDPKASPDNRPHHYPEHCVAYTGTHDNTTLADWLANMTHEERSLVRDYCGGTGCRDLIRCLWQSAAEKVIVPAQDLLSLDQSARINLPGTTGGNWLFRFTGSQLEQIDWSGLRRLNEIFGRAGSEAGQNNGSPAL